MNAALLWRREIILVRGREPEKALQRLKNAGIDLFDIKKVQKDAVTFCVSGKQARKVFAFYPKTWYNKAERGGYEFSSLKKKGIGEAIGRTEKRIGLIAGAAAFLLMTAFCDKLVFDVRYSGDPAACALAESVVKTYGVKTWARFDEKRSDEIAAKILSLDGVSYASVTKRGTVVYVEARRSSFSSDSAVRGDMKAKHMGTVKSVTALRGTKACAEGQRVTEGDVLVTATTFTGDGEGKKTIPATVSARVEIACVYEAAVCAENAAEAIEIVKFSLSFDEARLYAFSDGVRDIVFDSCLADDRGDGTFFVKAEYSVTETVNF